MEKPLVGMSLIIEHDRKFLKRLNLPDSKYVALIRIFLSEDWRRLESNKKPVIGIVNFTIDNNQNSFEILDPTKYGTKIPIELLSENDYFFDTKKRKFYKDTHEIKLKSIVDDLFRKHLKPTRFFAGMLLRIKIRSYRFLSKCTLGIAKFISRIFSLIFGEVVPYDFFSEYLQKHNPKKDDRIPSKKVKVINIFGYTASAHLIFFFCIFHLLGYFYVSYSEIQINPILIKILRNNFLTLSYSICLLYLLEECINPFFKKLLLLLLRLARYLHETISSKKIFV